MSPIAPLQNLPLSALATGLPGAAAVFRRCGIGFCGDGARSLAEAVAASEVSLPAMLGALEDLVGAARSGTPDGTEALIAFIVARYHERHRADLPRLIALAGEVEAAARDRPEAPRGLAELLDGMRAGLEEHMLKEELRVFPLMRMGRRDRLGAALALMRDEHADNAQFLLRVEALTRGYRLPPDAGPAWRDLYAELERVADDLVAHVYLEERVLFPRFEGPLA